MAKIGLDYGHGSNTFPPSKGLYKNGKAYHEHDFNALLGLKIKDLLEKNGHKVIEGQKAYQKDVPLIQRTNLYNREKVDIVVSVHANASGSKNVDGRCAFYWGTSSKGKKLASLIVNEIKNAGYSLHGNGLHAGERGSWTNLHITRETNMPAVLVENGFMTNDKDFELIFGSEREQYTDDLAKAYLKAIQKYFGEEVNETKPSKPKPQSKPSKDKVEWVGTSDKGKRVESIYKGSDGLNFYDSPRWNNPSGTFGYGMGWTIDNLYRVDGSLMYRVKNSKGDLYYITAHPKYVKVVGKADKTRKSISQMADEIIDGKHGNGHENRRKSLGISKSEYEKVRAEVNRRL